MGEQAHQENAEAGNNDAEMQDVSNQNGGDQANPEQAQSQGDGAEAMEADDDDDDDDEDNSELLRALAMSMENDDDDAQQAVDAMSGMNLANTETSLDSNFFQQEEELASQADE